MTAAITTLENLLAAGRFASQLEVYLNRTFRRGDSDGWYARTRDEEGFTAAERKLEEWVKAGHYDTYAASVEPVVRGIVALAKAKDGILVDLTSYETPGYSPFNKRYGGYHKFVAFSSVQAPGCGCMQPEGSYIFGPHGDFNVQAVVIETGYSYNSPKTELSLALPAWGTGRNLPKQGELVLATIDTSGYSGGSRYTPYIRTGEGTEEFTDSGTFLKYLLGMEQPEGIGAMQTSSGVGQVIGFPGAEDYLAAKLPRLGDYFVALAEKLSTPHTH